MSSVNRPPSNVDESSDGTRQYLIRESAADNDFLFGQYKEHPFEITKLL